jgi:hypothetical protein
MEPRKDIILAFIIETFPDLILMNLALEPFPFVALSSACSTPLFLHYLSGGARTLFLLFSKWSC